MSQSDSKPGNGPEAEATKQSDKPSGNGPGEGKPGEGKPGEGKPAEGKSGASTASKPPSGGASPGGGGAARKPSGGSDGPRVIDVESRPARRGMHPMKKIFWAIVALLVLAVVGAATYGTWRPSVAPYAAQVGIEMPDNLLVAGLEAFDLLPKPTEGAAPAASAADLSALQGVVADVSARLSTIEADAIAQAGLSTRLDTLSSRLDGLAERMTATEDAVAALSAAASSAPRAAAPTAGPAFADPTSRLDDLAGRLEALSGDLVALEALVEAGGAAGSTANDAPTSTTASAGTAPARAISTDPALLATLLQLAERVGRIEGRPVATPDDVSRLSLADRDAMDAVMEAREALSTTRDSVEATRVALANAREAIEATRGEIDGLKAEMADISASVATLGPERDTSSLLLLAVGQLTTATSGPGAFATELATARRIAGSDEATVTVFESLAAYAAGGTPSRTSLRARFPAVMEAALQTRAAGTAEGTIGEALNRVAALATVRKLSGNEVASVDAALNVAEVAVAEGDLAGAVDALSTLEGPAADKVAGWVADAKARLAVDAAVSTLSAVVLERLSSVE